mgnify:CR=1 FL=1
MNVIIYLRRNGVTLSKKIQPRCPMPHIWQIHAINFLNILFHKTNNPLLNSPYLRIARFRFRHNILLFQPKPPRINCSFVSIFALYSIPKAGQAPLVEPQEPLTVWPLSAKPWQIVTSYIGRLWGISRPWPGSYRSCWNKGRDWHCPVPDINT